MSTAFVGTRSLETAEQLKSLLQELPARSRCYFLRWVHKVSGFNDSLPVDFPSPKGEMVTPDFEVRWQQTQHGYDLLLLAQHQPTSEYGFQALNKDYCWVTSEPLPVHLSPNGTLQETEEKRQDTRFPRPLIYPAGLKLQQRYFQNKHTGTIHFVALNLVTTEEKKA
ncbi:hypothetical protein [Thermoleptolyngbya sp.]